MISNSDSLTHHGKSFFDYEYLREDEAEIVER